MFEGLLKIREANAEIQRLRVECDDWQKVNNDAITKIKERENELNVATEVLAERTCELEKSNERIAELEGSFISAEDKAAEIIAQIGVTQPVKIDPQDEPKTAAELWVNYHAITDAKEKQEFYKTHRTILKEQQ